jgi:sulfur carrier protein
MTITVVLQNRIFKIEAETTVKNVFLRLDLSPESYLIVRNGELINKDVILKDGDVIKLISAISGG